MKTVGEVSQLAGVSVRALHHYDELGLLTPSARSDAGYRLYTYDDLARLQEILVWRALGFALGEIGALLDDPGYDRLSALRRQGELVGRAGAAGRDPAGVGCRAGSRGARHATTGAEHVRGIRSSRLRGRGTGALGGHRGLP